jgi:hypothetical protein
VLTYAAILGATTVVWIAKVFTDEHRKAVQWLNELIKGDLILYAIELQVWRIGNSDPAPRFEVVCSPNEIVRQAAMAVEAEEFSETRRLQLEFWTEVRSCLKATGKFPTLQSPRAQYWFEVALGRAHIHLSLTANTYDKRVGVRLYLGHRVAEQALQQLEPRRQQIEHEIGSTLEWNPYPEKRDKIIRLTRPGDIADRATWPELLPWITATTVAFKQAFAPRIVQLDLSPADAKQGASSAPHHRPAPRQPHQVRA